MFLSIPTSRLAFFLCLYYCILAVPTHACVGKHLHEFHVSYCHAKWYLFFSRNSICFGLSFGYQILMILTLLFYREGRSLGILILYMCVILNKNFFFFTFQDEPFTSYMPEALFNISRFLLHELSVTHPPGISKFATMYTLAKQARNLEAYKLARHVLDRLQHWRVPERFQVS